MGTVSLSDSYVPCSVLNVSDNSTTINSLLVHFLLHLKRGDIHTKKSIGNK